MKTTKRKAAGGFKTTTSTASINASEHLDPDSLEFAAFEKLRRIGARRADGATFFHDGIEYGLIIDTPCQLELTHIVIARLPSPMGPGHMQAMASLCWTNQDSHNVKGLGLMMQALATGVVVKDATRPEKLSWRVLPMLPVPGCYAKPDNSHD